MLPGRPVVPRSDVPGLRAGSRSGVSRGRQRAAWVAAPASRPAARWLLEQASRRVLEAVGELTSRGSVPEGSGHVLARDLLLADAGSSARCALCLVCAG